MASRHRARSRSVQIIRVAEVAAKDVRRPYIKQLLVIFIYIIFNIKILILFRTTSSLSPCLIVLSSPPARLMLLYTNPSVPPLSKLGAYNDWPNPSVINGCMPSPKGLCIIVLEIYFTNYLISLM